MSKKRLLIICLVIIGVICLVILALGLGKENKKTATTSQRSVKVLITAEGFKPATLIVVRGTKIVWVNTDSAPHQIQANPHPTGASLPSLKSEILNKDQNYQFTADKTGVFGYHDHLTPTINGKIQVKN